MLDLWENFFASVDELGIEDDLKEVQNSTRNDIDIISSLKRCEERKVLPTQFEYTPVRDRTPAAGSERGQAEFVIISEGLVEGLFSHRRLSPLAKEGSYIII